MKILVVGGGPAGLYFGILMKRLDPGHKVVVLERNRPDDTFGFGVVFSDKTIGEVEAADPQTYQAITDHFIHWDDIDVHYGGEIVRSTGHGFSGLSRQTLLSVLQEQALALGIDIRFESEFSGLGPQQSVECITRDGKTGFVSANPEDYDLVIGSDGVNSTLRNDWSEHFQPTFDWRPNRFVWLGTTKPFPAFTFHFRENDHGLWRVHAYQYEPGLSTFIVECTEEAWKSAGMDQATEEETLAYCEALFAKELEGHQLTPNRSVWRSFPTIQCKKWHHENVVLLGDAAHTAHFSIGSGTRLGMLDGIALRDALKDSDSIQKALQDYETDRRPPVESLQRAAQASLEWFEATERYMDLDPAQFTFTLLTRSLRITHEDLRARDPQFLARVDDFVASESERQSGQAVPLGPAPPPMFTPFRLREMVLPNRVVVSPMCQYTAQDGLVGDWHLQHLGSRAIGGAGLVFAEMTDVSSEGRISPGCAGLYRPEHVDAWGRIVDFVHEQTPAKIAMQLGHAGRKGSTKNPWHGDSEPLEEGNWDLVSASPIPYFPELSQTPREMSRLDMDDAISDYVRATGYAADSGFDLLEIHMAHGYLLASFLSPLTNKRCDEYGGSLENRMRFPLEVFDACRANWPDAKPMSVRLSAVDWAPGGIEPADTVEIARLLKEHKCDVIDVSSGQTVPHQEPRYGRLYQTPFADQVRHEVGMATMAVGNISSWMDVNTIVAAGRADLCMIARAHLFDPYWTRHAAYMLGYQLDWPNQYKSVARYTPRFEFHFGGE